jgi:O-antigen ligase
MNNSVKARLLSSFDLFEGSNAERLKNWNEGWTMFADHPWSGVGIGNYSFHLDPTLPYRAPVYAHNLYLDLGAEMGMLALLSWVLLIAVTLWQLYRASLRTKNRALSFLAIGLIGALVWYSVHSFFDTSLFAPNILMALVAILSLSVLLIRRVKEEG